MSRATPRVPPLAVRVAAGVLAAVAAILLAVLLQPIIGEAPLPLFFAAVMLSAWYGGLGPGLVTTALCGIALDYLFERPAGLLAVSSPVTVIRVSLYVATAILISWLNGQRRSQTARAEAARAEAEHLAAIVSSSEDAVVGVDLDGTVRSWNAGAEQLYGYSAAEVLGTSVGRLAVQDEPDVLPRLLEYLRRGDRFGHFETVRVAKSGRRVEVSVSVSPVRDADGRIVGASLVERDVSLRAAAAEATERLAAIVRSSHDAILSTTLDGIITAWNPAAERLYGYPAHEAIGCSIEIVVPPERRREMERILAGVARGELTEAVETVRQRHDGRRVRVRLSVVPVAGFGGRVMGAAAIARAIDASRDVGSPPPDGGRVGNA